MFATYKSDKWFQVTKIMQVAAQTWTKRTQNTDLKGDMWWFFTPTPSALLDSWI